ncbi:MAG: hypothetical protein HY318_07175, partial [Armatimonadetes bacterium]|nr:hypothetical protein [Armatimonadota bacterium]
MGTFFLTVSFVLWGGLLVCYLFRLDSCASITLWPAWIWTLPGLLLTALGWRRDTKSAVAAMALMWLVYTVAFSEEHKSLIHHRHLKSPEWEAAKRQRKALRVVSLNCAGGSSEAAAEVIAEEPDVVLLQESPGRHEVCAIARRLYGDES